MIKPGIYKDLSNSEYHGDEGSISRSALMHFGKSAYNYWANCINPNRPPKEMSPSMILGRAFHEYILEPHEFDMHFRVKPPRVLLKNVGRQKYDEYKQLCEHLENSNYIILDDEEMLAILRMTQALQSHPQAWQLIMDATFEQSYFWKDKETGLMLKARPDIIHRNMTVDLKTCSDASPRAFQREIAAYGYHVQAAFIEDARLELEGHRVSTMINIAIETKYPHNIGVYIIDEEAVQIGRETYKGYLPHLKECMDTNKWPDIEVQTLSLPRWAL